MFNPFDTGAGEYDAWFTENEALFRSERDAVAMLYKGARPSCEIGAGTGVFADAFNVDTGIEPSKAMAEFARKRGISILEGVADALPLSDASQKAALMITVECFLPDCAAAFREVFRVLTDDGEFAHRVISPRYDVQKVYLATVENALGPEDPLRFREGLTLADGTQCLPAELEILGDRECLVTVREGK